MVCRGKQRCPKCGGDHRFEDYRDNEEDNCCNCGGKHRVSYSGCEVRKSAVEIQKVKAVNIIYAEAVKRVQRGRDEPVKVKQFSRSEMGQTEKLVTVFTVDNLILFMYVINCTDQFSINLNNCEGS